MISGPNEKNRPRVFSPRMDYEEWTPLGRGDPLKNDPTYDYVPPVLDRVQYWLDSHTTEASSKRDILILGVTAKKTSPKIPEQYLKFADSPKSLRNPEYGNSHGNYRNDFTGSTGAEPPKLIRTTSFRNGIIDYRNQNRIQSIPTSYYSSPYYNQKTKPYTMMLPPPIEQNPVADRPHSTYDNPSKDQMYADSHQYSTQTEEGPVIQSEPQQIYDYSPKVYPQPHPSPPTRVPHPQATSKPTPRGTVLPQTKTIKSYTQLSGSSDTKQRHEMTTPSVSFEKSNLVYHSSQTISGGWLGNNGPTLSSSSVDTNRVNWQTGTLSNNREHHYADEDDRQADGSSNHEVVIGQNANIIVQGDSSDNEEVVIGHKDVAKPPSEPSSTSNSAQTMIIETINDEDDVVGPGTSSANMHIVLANSPPTLGTTSDGSDTVSAVTVVMPSNYVDKTSNDTMIKDEEEQSQSSQQSLNEPEKPVPIEIEKPVQVSKPQPFRAAATKPPPMPVYHENLSAVSPPPTRLAMSYHQPPPRNSPPRLFAGASPQQMIHQQPSHARPTHVMMQYVPNLHNEMGMGLRAPPPPPLPSSEMPMSHAQLNMRHMQMQPSKSMLMRPPNMMNIEQQHNQVHRPYQHQSLPTTFTSSPLRPMTSVVMNPIHDLHIEDPQRRPEIIQTTTSQPSSTLRDTGVSLTMDANKDTDRVQSPLALILNDEESKKKFMVRPTLDATHSPVPLTSSLSPTTTVSSLTTDPIFSHYKQPAKPILGPMYLIIQGHSKVKTYKPSVNKHGIPVENNDMTARTTIRPTSKFDEFVNENTRRIANAEKILSMKKKDERPKKEAIRHERLSSLVETGFGAFTVPSRNPDEENFNSVTTVDLGGQ